VLGIPPLPCPRPIAARDPQDPYWDTALKFAPDLIRRVLADGIAARRLRQHQFSGLPPQEVRGVAVTSQGKRPELLRIEPRYDGRGNPYYWIAFERNGRVRAQRHRSVCARGQPDRGDAVASRHDGRPFMTRLAEILVSDMIAFAAPRYAHRMWAGCQFLLDLRRAAIMSADVLRAMDEVPREPVRHAEPGQIGYSDRAMPDRPCGQTITQPYIVAYMTEQLRPSASTMSRGRDPVLGIRRRCCRGW